LPIAVNDSSMKIDLYRVFLNGNVRHLLIQYPKQISIEFVNI